jgi:hypothetical protein
MVHFSKQFLGASDNETTITFDDWVNGSDLAMIGSGMNHLCS